jgi:3-oxoacid CoA-transferase subunit A
MGMTCKVFASAKVAIEDLKDDTSIMVGGFGLCGNPEHLIDALAANGAQHLTIISNNCGNQGQGLAILLQQRQVAAWKGSFMGGNPDIQQQHKAGDVDVELIPQGTLAERIRAGGAGIPAFYTPTGVGTVVADSKEERAFDGKRAILERALTAEWAFVRARRGDSYGNLQFHGTTQNFQVAMAMAGHCTVAEVDELVPMGALSPAEIHLPGIFVQRIFQAETHRDPFEYRMTRPRP